MDKKTTQQQTHDYFHKVMEQTIEAWATLKACMDTASMDKMSAYIAQCQGVCYITGVGKAGCIAKKCVATAQSYGLRCFFLSPMEALHGDSGCVRAEDMLWYVSHSGNTQELLQLHSVIKPRRCLTVALLGAVQSSLAEKVDHVVAVGKQAETCYLGVAPTLSVLLMQCVADMILAQAASRLGVGVDDFKRAHPGGQLAIDLSDAGRAGDHTC